MDVQSRITGRTYRVWIARPLVPAPANGFPILYLTDGNVTFRQTADQMWAREFVDIKPAIIIGIGYPSDDIWEFVRLRNKDLTPEKPSGVFLSMFEDWGKAGNFTVDDSGGAELFFRFLTEELRPKLAGMLPVNDSDQALFGHSLGGLFALHVLFKHPNAFNTYVISSPSILYNSRSITRGEADLKAALQRAEVAPRILLLVGGEENWPNSETMAMMPPVEQLRWAQFGRGVDNTVEMAARLRAMPAPPGYQVEHRVFDGENHLSVMPVSLTRALSFAFSVAPRR